MVGTNPHCHPYVPPGLLVLHLQGVPADGSNSSVSSYALLPIVLSFDYRATQLDLALNKQTEARKRK